MTVPLLIAFWRCACGTLDIYADQQWSEVRKLAESYEVDIDHATDSFPEVPAAENFISQAYLQACLFDQEGEAVEPMLNFTNTCREPLKNYMASLDAGTSNRLDAVLGGIRKVGPEFLPDKKTDGPAAEVLLRVTDHLGIPWKELDEAAKRPHSQLPPMGSTEPPEDDDSPRLTHSVSSIKLFKLSRAATLRTHAALAAKKPELALGSLRIQSRLVEAHFNRPTLLSAMLGTAMFQSMIFQIHEGFRKSLWRDGDIRWIAEWAGKIDFESVLTEASKMECVYSIRYMESLRVDPGFEDRMVRNLEKNAAMREMLSDTALPFLQDWLRPFRGRSEALYRLAPQGAFTLLKTSGLKTYFHNHLALLKKGGLHEYAWPEKENRVSSKVISYARLGIGFATNQSRLNLLRTACALHQWHAAHGDYPKKLDELQPDLPESACMDVCTGKTVHYKRISKGSYRLYAVGMDAIDDGGKPVVNEKGDIVWK